MSSVPISPRLQKGAIVAIEGTGPATTIITFQYNPETLSRTIKPRWMENASKSEVSRLSGAPEEDIKVDIELDASDGLEVADADSISMGVYPQLSALEMIVYPRSEEVIANGQKLQTGTLEIIPTSGPFTLFVWGERRVLPVRINDISITEELHDPNLNPIRVKVSLGMKVLSYSDLSISHRGYGVFLTHQSLLESMAKIGSRQHSGPTTTNIRGV